MKPSDPPTLVIVGTLLRPTRRAWGLALLTTGALLATNSTFWTLLLPIVAVVVVVAAYRARRAAGRTGIAWLKQR